MKILFLSEGSHTCDYLRDMVFHGLRALLGPDVVDVNRLNSLYQGADKSQMYGRGFSIYGLLPEIPVDREDIPRKIRDRYFDLVIYGSIHRHHDYLHEVATQYDPTRVIFLDGEDHTGYLKGLGGVYFKRELHNPQPGVWPIQFAIPEEKILKSPPAKAMIMAPCDPIDRATYIYETEESYYQQYADSYFAPTMKKAGWDCLRHYEIMANWAIPYFRCFDKCPPDIMMNLPRAELYMVQQCIETPAFRRSTLIQIYEDYIHYFMEILRARMTTVKLAEYVLNTVGVAKKETLTA